MTTTTEHFAVAEYTRQSIFRRILVGIDDQFESLRGGSASRHAGDWTGHAVRPPSIRPM